MEHDSPKLLFRQACEYLSSSRLVRPGVVKILERVAAARERAREETWTRVAPLLGPRRQAELDEMLTVDPVLGRTRLSWLGTGPVAATPAAVKDELEKLAYLRGLDADTLDLSVLPAERRRFLAGVGRRLTPQHLARREPARRYPILLTLIAQSAVDVLDEVLLLSGQALSGRESAARARLTEMLAERARGGEDRQALLDDILKIVLDPGVADDQVGARLRGEIGHERMRAAWQARREPLPRDHGHLAMMDASMAYLRQFVPDVLAAIRFAGGPGMDDLLQAVTILAGLYATRARKVPDGAPGGFVPARWAGYLEKAAKDGDVTAYRHYWELCALMALRDGLRSGDVHVPGSRRHFRVFKAAWPKMAGWFAAPLAERVGRLPGETQKEASYPISFQARPYLVFLGLRGYLTLDYAWMLGAGQIRVDDAATAMGIDLGTGELIEEAVGLGYNRNSARQAMRWTAGRIALQTGIQHAGEITQDHITQALEAVRLFSERDDLHVFYPSAQNYRDNAAKQWITHLHQLQVVLFHRGQIATQPRKLMPSWKPPLVLPPRMQVVADKWLAARRLTDAPMTVEKLEIAVRKFGEWLAEHHSEIVSYADVTRDHCLAWAGSLIETPTEKTGKPLGAVTRIQRISGLSQMFRDAAAWEYNDVPGFAPITPRDAPKLPQRIPRFIPDHELELVMPVINDITCPFQRAALLIARWSGARRDEIRHLPLDCLDHYPDGTPRLRLPGRKTYKGARPSKPERGNGLGKRARSFPSQ